MASHPVDLSAIESTSDVGLVEPREFEDKSSPNDTNPIAIIPFDILTHIFDIARCDPDGYTDYVTTWLVWITWVCRRWRMVALEAPYLWAHVNSTNLDVDCTSAFLLRSGKSMLHVELEESSIAKVPGIEEVLRSEVSRIRHLHVYGIPLLTFRAFSQSSPLQTLSISCQRQRIRIDEMLELLSCLPTLVWLTLTRALTLAPEDIGRLLPVSLPNLKVLTMERQSNPVTSDFLQYLSITNPLGLDLTIHTTSVLSTRDSFLRLFHLFDKMTPARVPEEEKLTIRVVTILNVSVVKGLGEERVRKVPKLLLRDIPSMFQDMPLHRLKSLELMDTKPPPPEEFWDVFSQQPNLHHIHMTISAVASFSQFLAAKLRDHSHAVPFLALRSLTLERSERDRFGDGTPTVIGDWTSLRDGLEGRKERGFGLETLTLKHFEVGFMPQGFEYLATAFVLEYEHGEYD